MGGYYEEKNFMSDHVLGIKIVDVERKQISIEPHLGKLEWAKGILNEPQQPDRNLPCRKRHSRLLGQGSSDGDGFV